MSTELKQIKERINEIEARNKRVELDKAWETSITRRLFIICFTYITLGIYMSIIGVEKPWINAIIPSAGFLLSTLTLPYVRNIWEASKNKF